MDGALSRRRPRPARPALGAHRQSLQGAVRPHRRVQPRQRCGHAGHHAIRWLSRAGGAGTPRVAAAADTDRETEGAAARALASAVPALARVRPEGEIGLALIEEPAFHKAFIRASVGAYLSGKPPIDFGAALMPFAEP